MNLEKKEKALFDLIGGPFWGLNKTVVKVFGIECALWLTDVFSKYLYFEKRSQLDEEGYFFNTQEAIETDTTLNSYQQNNILKRLKELGIIDVKRKGLPARNFYRINLDKLLNHLDSSYLKIKQLDAQELGNFNKNKGNDNKGNDTPSKEGVSEPDGSGPTLPENLLINKPVLRRRKIPESEKPPFIPEDLKEIMTIWNNSGLRRHQDPTSKVYKDGIYGLKKLKRGVFFSENTVSNGYQDRKFTKEDIIKAIENFKLAALNPDYEPTGGFKEYLKKLSLPDFLYNPFSQNGEKSLFIRYFEGPPQRCSESVRMPTDYHPEYTKVATEMYIAKAKGGIDRLSPREKVKLVYAGKEIHDFFEVNKKRVDPMFVRSPREKTELVMDCLMENYKDGIQVGNLCSQYTFDTLLPIYLERQGVLR